MEYTYSGLMGTIRAVLEYHAGVAPMPADLGVLRLGGSDKLRSGSIDSDILAVIDDHETRRPKTVRKLQA